MEGELTLNEPTESLKNMKNNMSPGQGWFPAEVYKAFWDSLGPTLLRALNYYFNRKEMSNSQPQGIIICMPKGGNPENF